jgi:N-methylhydantoinase B
MATTLDLTAAQAALDPVTREILHRALIAVTEEMAVVQYRSSFSPIIREIKDFSCGLFDAQGRIVAHSEAIPAQLGLMQFALEGALQQHGALDAGDLVLCNHPYRGGTHTPDLELFAPIHVDGALVGYAGSIAHHINIGGSKSGDATDNSILFEEGLLCPAVKLEEGGRPNGELMRMIAANVRDPDATTGDLAAQGAACRRGGERIAELCERHSVATILAAMEAVLEQTSARVRAELDAWPTRRVSVEGHMDYDSLAPGEPVRIAATVWVEEGQLVVDLSDSSPEVRGSINVPWSSTCSAGYYALRCFAGEEIEMNEGLTRHVRVISPEGTIFRPRFPRPVAGRHLTVQRLAELLCRALGELLPASATASSHVSFPSFNFQTIAGERERLFLFADVLGGGGGARPDAPGDNAIDSYTSNCALLSAEIVALEYPWRVECTRLLPESGGAGRFPGGQGLRRDYRLLGEAAEGPYYVEQSDPRFAARGQAGGERGASSRVRLKRGDAEWVALPAKGYAQLQRGDVISFESAGGGGYGPPGHDETT